MGMFWCGLVGAALVATHALGREALTNKTINFIWIQPNGASSPYANLADGRFDDLPMARFFTSNIEAWQQLNPSWAIRLWDSQMCQALVQQHFPKWLPYYKKLGPVSKADVARLMILVKYAGVYSDLDGLPSKAVEDILTVNSFNPEHDAVLFIHSTLKQYEVEETSRFAIRRGKGEISKRLSMGFLCAVRHASKVLSDALDLALKRLIWVQNNRHKPGTNIDWADDYLIVFTTGPDILSEAAYRNEDGGESNACPDSVLCVARESTFVIDAGTTTWRGQGVEVGAEQSESSCASSQSCKARQRPNQAHAFSNLAFAFQNVGRTSEAVHMLHSAVELAPTNAGFLNNLAVALGKSRRMKEASYYLYKSVALDKSSPGVFASLGFALQAQGKHAEALESFQQVLLRKPMHPTARIKIAMILKKVGRFEESCEVYQQVVHVQNKNAAQAELVCVMAGHKYPRLAPVVK